MPTPQRLTTVHLHGHLGRQFGRQFRFAAETPAQALALLEANFPEWRGVMLNAAHPFRVTAGRSDHRDERGLTKRLGKARTIHIVPLVSGSNNGPVKMLAGAVLIVAGAAGIIYGEQFGGAKWGPQLMGMGIGMFAGGASQWLARGPNMDQRNRDDEGRRASYVFNGVVNTMAQGGCVPVLYGKLRHGGYIISAGVSAEEIEIAPSGVGFRILTNLSYQVQRGGDVARIDLVASGGVAPYTWTTGPGCPSWVTIQGSTLVIDPTNAPIDTQHDFEVLCQGSDGITVGGLFRLTVGTMGHVTSGSGGSDSPSQHVPSESPDSLQSRAVARLLLLLGEGPVGGPVDGLKSVYLDGTPIQNADGSYNFKLLKDPEFRLGMPTQDPLTSWSEVESEQTDGRELKASAPVVLTVGDSDADSLRLNIGYPSLCKSLDNGDLVGSMASVSVYVKPNGGEAWILAQTVTAVGKATTRYQKSALLRLRNYGPGPWQVKLERSTPDSATVSENNKTVLDSYTLIQECSLTYPNRYILGLTLDASQFQGIPTVGVESKGRIVRVPSNYDPETRTYSGIWDGTWKLAWTDNPAWAFLDLLTHPRYGLGRYVSLSQVAAPQLYQVARYCDGMVSDGRGGTEPRFALNAYLQQATEAYSVLQNLAAAFRGMSYWGSGSVQVAQDSPADPVALFTESNVVDGLFNYQSTSRRSRHNAVSVGWNDPLDAYKIKSEYVSDPQDIAKNGLRQAEEIALGCTSQGQAHRWGLWRLYVERAETEVVTFSTGMEGLGLRPGDLIHIQDQSRVLNRLGGRILASDGQHHTLDSAPQVGPGSYRLWCVLPSGATAAQGCINISGATVTTEAFPEVPGEMAQWILQDASQPPKTYRVLSVREVGSGSSYDVTALVHDPGKYDAIETGWTLPDRPNIPQPVTLGPVSQLSLSSREVVHEDYVSNVLVAAWAIGPGASRYRVDWRRDGGNWTESSSTTNSWELVDCTPATYEVRVTSLDARGAAALAVSKSLVLAGSLRDDWITPAEKPTLVKRWADAQAEKTTLVALADKAGADKAPMQAVFAALESYLGTITGWNVVPGSMVYLGTGGGLVWEDKWGAYRTEALRLHQAVSGGTRDRLNAYVSDGILAAGAEKTQWQMEWTRAQAEYAQLLSQSQSLGTDYSYLQAAKNALGSYIGTLTPSLSDSTQDTLISPASWTARWQDYWGRAEEARTFIAAALKGRADAAANTAPGYHYTRPALPDSRYPAGRMCWQTSDSTMWVSTGSTWEPQQVSADRIFGLIIAGAVATGAVTAQSLAADLALISQLRCGYSETADGTPVTGAQLDGRAGKTPLKLGYRGVQIGRVLLGEAVARGMSALDSTTSDGSEYRAFYKGNSSPLTRRGAPNPDAVESLQLIASYSNGTMTWLTWRVTIRPRGLDDNLDGMRTIRLYSGYHMLGEVACPDRGYYAGGDVTVTVQSLLYGNFAKAPYGSSLPSVAVVLRNAYGWEGQAEFFPNAAGDDWTRKGLRITSKDWLAMPPAPATPPATPPASILHYPTTEGATGAVTWSATGLQPWMTLVLPTPQQPGIVPAISLDIANAPASGLWGVTLTATDLAATPQVATQYLSISRSAVTAGAGGGTGGAGVGIGDLFGGAQAQTQTT